MALTTAERFWPKVAKRPGHCWLWTGAKSSRGYGALAVDGGLQPAHRVSYRLAHGEDSIPPNMLVRHTCHNRLCVNPDHLRLGTQQENMLDKLKAGRHPRGVEMPGAKLTDDAVREIRRCAGTLDERARLMVKYRVSEGCIHSVYNRKSWRHVRD